jgi:hypothetical protein
VERRFVSIADPSRVTVGELRRAADRVGADLAVVVQESQPIVTVRRGDLVDADADDAIAAHLGRLTKLKDAPLGSVAAGARVAAESDFAFVVRGGEALIVLTPGPLRWPQFGGPTLEAYAAAAQLPGEIPEPPDPPIRCTCRFGDVVTGPASNPPRQCANGHPVMCE